MFEISNFLDFNIVDALTLIALAVGGVFGYIQWCKTNELRRAEFVDEINKRFRFDKDVTEMIYRVDHDNFSYDENTHKPPHEDEELLDKVLSIFSYICYLNEKKMLEDEEFDFYHYSIIWFCKDENIQNYLWNMHHFSKKNGCPSSFEALIKFCKSKKIFNESFDEYRNYDIFQAHYNPREYLDDGVSPMNYGLRPVKTGEVEILRKLVKQCRPLDLHTRYTYWLTVHLFDKYCFFIEDDTTPIGFITAIKNDDCLFIWQIGILKKYRKQQLSYELINGIVQIAKNEKISKIQVSIAEKNTISYKTFHSYCVNNDYIIDRVEEPNLYSFASKEVLYNIIIT